MLLVRLKTLVPASARTLVASWAEVSVMEQHFLDILKPAWDACEWAPQLSLRGFLCPKTLGCDSRPSTSYWESPQAACYSTDRVVGVWWMVYSY